MGRCGSGAVCGAQWESKPHFTGSRHAYRRCGTGFAKGRGNRQNSGQQPGRRAGHGDGGASRPIVGAAVGRAASHYAENGVPAHLTPHPVFVSVLHAHPPENDARKAEIKGITEAVARARDARSRPSTWRTHRQARDVWRLAEIWSSNAPVKWRHADPDHHHLAPAIEGTQKSPSTTASNAV